MSTSKAATVEEASSSPEPERDSSLTENPPLPSESEPTSVSVAPPLPDETVTGGSTQTSGDVQNNAGKHDEVWDPAAETDLKGRKAVEEKNASQKTETGGWQAVWAPAANG
jgi:hypothetical protein